jgi:ribosome-associated toxin RatA of RatAB toxin-antitoxin module
MVSHSEIVDLPIDSVWIHFVNKIEHPENFVPGVSDVIINEKTNEHVIRTMHIVSPKGEKAIMVENITHAPYWVKFSIIDHPVFTGFVDNVAEKISESRTRITFAIHWVNKQTAEPFADQDLVRNAVLKTADFMMKSKIG